VRPALLLAALGSALLLDAPGVVVSLRAQVEVTDQALVAASEGRTVAIGALSGDGHVTDIPLELYVARVLAGEAEPNAAPAAHQSLAVAVRTYALVQTGRHRREGFDLCDTVHCQVLRTASDASRRAAMATAGRVLTVDGKPAELFYSASCGGRSEGAAQVWPGATFPYMQSVTDDDVHADDVPWTLDLTVAELQLAFGRAGFGGRLRDLDIVGRNASGRVNELRLDGLQPDAVAGTTFRDIIGTTRIRSTAFSLDRQGDRVRFTGRGYGHGVGMCVVGAGRRALRGESVEDILAQYYPALTLVDLRNGSVRLPVGGAGADEPLRARSIVARVSNGSTVSAADLEDLATRAYTSLSQTLGTSVTPVTVELHPSLDRFRLEVRRPWWVSATVTGTTIDLAPAALLAQRDGLEATLRTAMAELLMSVALVERPAWVRVGGARYFASQTPPVPPAERVACPADAELLFAPSAVTQREAEDRALRCFARAYATTRDWRTIR
jgi:SpoIID/LytB domain protein